MTALMIAPPATWQPYQFSVEEFDRMIESGFFVGKRRVELIEGQVLEKMVPNPPHDNCVDNINVALLALVPAGWRVRVQSAITLSASVPSPDLCVARGDSRTYATRRPSPTDIALLVEVSDSTLADDQGAKLQMYARDGIAEYWIVNIPDRQIEVYTQPSGPTSTPTFGRQQVYPSGSSVRLTLDGVQVGTVAVDDVIF